MNKIEVTRTDDPRVPKELSDYFKTRIEMSAETEERREKATSNFKKQIIQAYREHGENERADKLEEALNEGKWPIGG